LWLRRAPEETGPISSAPKPGFFDQYPRFYSSSIVGATPERLNERYRALISPNEQSIRERTILDLAAHDGRWSFAALKAGARHVTGIEVRSHLVEAARAAVREYGIGAERYQFIAGDVFDQIELIQPNSIDTVFCFGVFYHTPHHVLLLSKIARLNPKCLILDTEIDRSTTDCVIRLRKEEVTRDANSLVGQPGDPLHALVGKPSRSALETMLTSFGWSLSYYDWHRAGISNWRELNDYRNGSRVSIVATRGSIQRG
jgi:16S rRNA G966 N2-methylase RsmD